MATIGQWFQTAFHFLFEDVLGTEIFGVRVRTIALSLAVLSAVVRFFVVPFFAGSFSHVGSDFVKLKHRSRSNDNE